jgi:hypothetical protein
MSRLRRWILLAGYCPAFSVNPNGIQIIQPSVDAQRLRWVCVPKNFNLSGLFIYVSITRRSPIASGNAGLND